MPNFPLPTPIDAPRPALARAAPPRRRAGGAGGGRNPAQALDAAELVGLDIDPLPAVADTAAAVRPGAPRSGTMRRTMSASPGMAATGGGGAAFAQAAHVTRLRLVNNRVIANPIEPRSSIATYDAAMQAWRLHRRHPGRAVHGARAVRAHLPGAARAHAGLHPRRGRRLRGEGAALPGGRGDPARRPRAGPPGEVARHAHGAPAVRQPRPRRGDGGRAGAGRGGELPGRAAGGAGRDGRLLLGARPLRDHPQHHQRPAARLPHAGDRRDGEAGADQHRLHRPLPRRRARGRGLRDGAAGRPGRAGDAARPGRAAPAQPDPGRGHALQLAGRADLRQRRFRGRAGPRPRARRLGRLCGPGGGLERARA